MRSLYVAKGNGKDILINVIPLPTIHANVYYTGNFILYDYFHFYIVLFSRFKALEALARQDRRLPNELVIRKEKKCSV